METADEEFLNATLDFIDRANRDKKPFFAWFNSTRIHIWTRLKPEAQGKTGLRREQHWVCRSERVELVAATLVSGARCFVVSPNWCSNVENSTRRMMGS